MVNVAVVDVVIDTGHIAVETMSLVKLSNNRALLMSLTGGEIDAVVATTSIAGAGCTFTMEMSSTNIKP